MKPLTDFPAVVARVGTMADKSIRLVFDLPETETEQLSKMHLLMTSDTYIRVVIYDAEEYQNEPQSKMK